MSSGILAACLRTTGLPLMGVIAAAIYYYDMTKNVVAFMQVYGWFVVLGCVGLFYLDHLFAIELAKWDRQQSLNAANAPERVQILEVEARRARELQQAKLEAEIKAKQAQAALKKKAQPSPAKPPSTNTTTREYNMLDGT
ncbi:hypothetical protein, variant 1 [Aphanomyces invadans]|uniref:Uncharacterized protein n=1 Tax=Aphanomyces invadans TaxID=157072 RepID=A0A024TDV5_9STRA|nr:hypothetical protein, variant 1 [Aphanomyces invadans]ETV92330.1 hypothetical protein, variant 1 [Aphanomyces invadans]|eukprot:XP_008879081.1 hypothetical protein, variant 1 [Aphanomyces invadans]